MTGKTKQFGKKIALALGAFFFALIIAEMIAWLILPAPPRQDPGFFPFQKSAIAQVHYELKPKTTGWWYGAFVETGEQKRRDRDRPLQKNKDTFRIVVIGDSDTFGYGVSFKETYCFQLEKLLNDFGEKKYEVLNFGVPGYNAVQEAAVLRHRAMRYLPDLVVIGYVLNDTDAPIPFFPAPQKNNGKPTPKPKLTISIRLYNFIIKHSNLALWGKGKLRNILYNYGFVNVARKNYHQMLYEDTSPGWIKNQKALANMVSITKAKAVPLTLMIIPMLVNLNDSYPYTSIHQKVRKEAQKHQIKVLDLFPFFKGMDASQLHTNTTYDTHPNGIAHKIIAKKLLAFLKRHKLLLK